MNTLQPIVDLYESTKKWGQGYHGPSEPYACLVEAAGQCGGFRGLMAEITRRLRIKNNSEIMTWNDATGRIFEEVMEMLKQDDDQPPPP